MNSNQKTARIVGLLFIIGTVAGILSVVFTQPILGSSAYLTEVSANQSQLILGALFVLIMGFALAMVPVMLFPIFRHYNEPLALGAILFRGALEAVAYIAIAAGWLLLIPLSQAFVEAGTANTSAFEALGLLLLESTNWLNHILAIVFSLGALMIYSLFYQSRLIPRWLSIWGLVGGTLYLAVPLLGMFGMELGFLMAPLGLQEMVLAVWLIVKGMPMVPSQNLIAGPHRQPGLQNNVY